jgi:hypothetical protein
VVLACMVVHDITRQGWHTCSCVSMHATQYRCTGCMMRTSLQNHQAFLQALTLDHSVLHKQSTICQHHATSCAHLQAVESSLADSWVRWGDRLGLQRRLLRLSKPPRRWRRPSWAPQAEWEPPEHGIVGRPLNCTTGLKSRSAAQMHVASCDAAEAGRAIIAGCWISVCIKSMHVGLMLLPSRTLPAARCLQC